MKRFTMIAFAAATFLFACVMDAFAVKQLHRVGPGSKEVAVDAHRTDDGRIAFTVRRDPKKSRFGKRDAMLSVFSASGFVASCPVAEASIDKVVTYRFIVSPEFVDNSSFVLTELQTDGGPSNGEELIGGGDIFEISLGNFMPGRGSKK